MELGINDLRQLIAPATSKDDLRGTVRIVVLQRGWVAVGRFYQIGDQCRLEGASIVRRWGTTKGLGELAERGPLPETVLDKADTIYFPELGIVCAFSCNAEKWIGRCN